MTQPTAMQPAVEHSATTRGGWVALAQVVLLAMLSLLVIRGELHHMWVETWSNPEAAHTYVLPILIALLLLRHRALYARSLSRGSAFGILLILLGLGLFLVTSWPFNYGYPRRVALVPMIAGSVLAVCGWRVFLLSIPIFMLLVLAIPTGSRYYAFLIIEPETRTLEVTRLILDLIPGVFVDAEGPDLQYITDTTNGPIALGESNRGVSMLLPSLAVGLFVIFSSARPIWKYIAALLVLVPIALLCNVLRFITFGLLTIIWDIEPTSSVPRTVSAVVCLVLAYAMYCGLVGLLGNGRAVSKPVPGATS